MSYVIEYEQAGMKRRSKPFKSFWMALEYKIMMSGAKEAKIVPISDFEVDLLNAKKTKKE